MKASEALKQGNFNNLFQRNNADGTITILLSKYSGARWQMTIRDKGKPTEQVLEDKVLVEDK